MRLTAPDDRVVLSEHHAVVDEEYRFAGQVRHRQRDVSTYAVCCLDCGANHTAGLLVWARQWKRRHVCEAPTDRADTPASRSDFGSNADSEA